MEKVFKMKLKELLNKKSKALNDYGWIYYIRSNLGYAFLNTGITLIVEAVPEIFSFDLPEQVERGLRIVNDKQTKWFNKVNANLVIPVFPSDVVNIIRIAKEYLNKETV
jgi:hypothetical protein